LEADAHLYIGGWTARDGLWQFGKDGNLRLLRQGRELGAQFFARRATAQLLAQGACALEVVDRPGVAAQTDSERPAKKGEKVARR
jgi:hypothetical protein